MSTKARRARRRKHRRKGRQAHRQSKSGAAGKHRLRSGRTGKVRSTILKSLLDGRKRRLA